jgi:hypothetical protein
MKRSILFIPLALFTSFSSLLAAEADVPSEDSIKELLELMETEKILEQTMEQMEQIMQVTVAQSMQGQSMSAEDQEDVSEMQSTMMEWLSEELNYDFLLEMYIPAYKETFNQLEVDQLIEFYESPVGKMFVKKQPQLMQSFMQRYQKQIGPMMQRFQGKLQENLEEITSSPASK